MSRTASASTGESRFATREVRGLSGATTRFRGKSQARWKHRPRESHKAKPDPPRRRLEYDWRRLRDGARESRAACPGMGVLEGRSVQEVTAAAAALRSFASRLRPLLERPAAAPVCLLLLVIPYLLTLWCTEFPP